MGTQAVVSVVDERGDTIVKAICGCNGRSARALGDKIQEKQIETADDLLRAAREVDFGCLRCLVVMEEDKILCVDKSSVSLEWRKTFLDPWFNPRWSRGTADYHVVIERGIWLELEMPERIASERVSLPYGTRI